jgi:hypothetical protein
MQTTAYKSTQIAYDMARGDFSDSARSGGGSHPTSHGLFRKPLDPKELS